MNDLKSALTIAGSDPSGGAGIQADLKTFHRFGVYGQAAVTLLTVQNTRGVQRVERVDVNLVMQQIEAVLDDIPPDAAKTGALGSVELIEAVGSAAAGWSFPLIVDPVMIGKHGTRLAPIDAPEAYRKYLIPHAAVLTPNLPEAEALCGFPVRTLSEMEDAARALAQLGARSVLIKGGHLGGDPVDVLLCGHIYHLAAMRIETSHTHGTGCTYAAAITAGLAKNLPVRQAVEAAHSFVHRAIRDNPGLGHGSGPLNHWV